MKTAVVAALLIGLFTAPPRPALAQDEALRDRVAQLVERLEAPKVEARDVAEKALIALGPQILPFLPEGAKADAKDRDTRLDRIRAAVREALANVGLGEPTRVNLNAKGMRLSEVIRKLQTDSGNPITDVRDQYGGDSANPAIDLELQDKPFLEALDAVAKAANVSLSFYTGDGSIGLMPAPTGDAASPSADTLFYRGPFRIEAVRFTQARDFRGRSTAANLQLEVAWEPRLRPMLLAVKAEDLSIVDDQGRAIKPSVMEESASVVLRPENPVAEFNLNMEGPSADAKALKSVKVKAEVTVPAAMKAFRFPSLAGRKVEQKDGDVGVTLVDTVVDESNWLVTVEVAYPGGGAAFESYQQGLFNNRVFLQKGKDLIELNGGFNQVGGGDGKLAFEYIFVDLPGKPADYQLVYETPSKVVTIPLEFELVNLPLP